MRLLCRPAMEGDMSRRSLFAACLALVYFAWLCPPAGAFVIRQSSLEWLTCEAEVVVVGKIETIVTTRGAYDIIYDDCTVVVEEVLKGKAGKRLVFCFRTR